MGASKEECIRWCTLCHLANTTKPHPYAAAMWPFVTTCMLLCTVVGDLASDHNHTCVMVNKNVLSVKQKLPLHVGNDVHLL